VGVAWRWRGGLEIGVGSGLALVTWSVDYWATAPTPKRFGRAMSAPRRAVVVGLHGLVKGKGLSFGLGRLWAVEGSWALMSFRSLLGAFFAFHFWSRSWRN